MYLRTYSDHTLVSQSTKCDDSYTTRPLFSLEYTVHTYTEYIIHICTVHLKDIVINIIPRHNYALLQEWICTVLVWSSGFSFNFAQCTYV